METRMMPFFCEKNLLFYFTDAYKKGSKDLWLLMILIHKKSRIREFLTKCLLFYIQNV